MRSRMRYACQSAYTQKYAVQARTVRLNIRRDLFLRVLRYLRVVSQNLFIKTLKLIPSHLN